MSERDDKKNTDLWKQKQEEKKKKKEAQAQGQAQPSKAEKKKEKKKDQKKQEKPEQQSTKTIKQDQKDSKQQEKPQAAIRKQSEANQPDQPCSASVFKQLTKIDDLLTSKDRASRIYQEELITKYMDQYLSENDIVLYVGKQSRIQQHQQVYVQGLNNCQNAELLCRYSDLSYFLESSVTKIFIEADYIFSNGSILTKQGSLSIALMASFYNIPVIAIGGSWIYNGWAPVNFEALEEKYGSENLKKLDWIQDKYLRGAIAEVGVINPRQVSIYPSIIYKQLQLLSIQW